MRELAKFNPSLLFHNQCIRIDLFYLFFFQVRLSKHVLSTQEKGSFLAISLGTVLIRIKRNFDKFMQMQLRSIEEARAPSR